jgi:hypothetical protein
MEIPDLLAEFLEKRAHRLPGAQAAADSRSVAA